MTTGDEAAARSTWSALAHQHLISPLSGPGSVVAVADDAVGLHATMPDTSYLSLHARVAGFAMDDLDDALYERRSLMRLRAMRGTVFIVSRELAPIVFAATSDVMFERDLRFLGLDSDVYAEAAPRVMDALADRSLTVAQLRRHLHADVDLSGVVGLLCDEGLVVRDRPTGSRRSSSFRYRRWDQTFPDVDLAAYDRSDATAELVRRYIAGYGPASHADVVWWTGLPARRVRAALARLGDEVRAVRHHDGQGRRLDLLDAMGGRRHPRRRPRPVVLLPHLDPYTMGYRDRERFLDPDRRDWVYDRGGNAAPVVLLDGRVGGVWDLTDVPAPAGRMLLFDPGDPRRQLVVEEVRRTAGFWFGHDVPVHEFTGMVPLRQRTGVMRRPLDGATFLSVAAGFVG